MTSSTILRLVITVLMFGSVVAALGGVIRVPGDYPTIQEGLDAAAGGDTVLVAAGVYYENIVWPDVNGIALISESGAASTVIDGNDTARVITMMPVTTLLDSSTIVQGFTIQDGRVTGSSSNKGGGILCFGFASPIIQNNIIISNYAEDQGGGIYCLYSYAIIRSNTITHDTSEVGGGGVHCTNSSPRIFDNVIAENVTGGGSFGGGVACWGGLISSIISDNLISANTAGHGAGISFSTDTPGTISCNTISNNVAQYDGGGIYCGGNMGNTALIHGNTLEGNTAGSGAGISLDLSSPRIEHNVIEYNTASGIGGAIICKSNSSPTITFNTIAENSATTGGGIATQTSSCPSVHQNNIFGNIHYAVYNADASVVVDAEYNWWGDPTGPYHPSNPDGLGDTVGNYIDYAPWLTQPFVSEEQVEIGNRITTAMLHQNSPNPFSLTTSIAWQISDGSYVSLRFYDIVGRLVKILVDGAKKPGRYSVVWDGRDEYGRAVPTGVYFYRLKARDITASRKLLLLR